MSYAQNREDEIVLSYFRGFKGTLLSIGENDGQTFSNANLLIQYGWKAHLVEPSSVFEDMQALHAANARVSCYNYGIGEVEDTLKFFESGAHVPGGADKALVSTFDPSEMDRWAGVDFVTKEIQVKPFDIFWLDAGLPAFEFISIDAEGFDWAILQQIDLQAVGCRALCIEWNGDYELYHKYVKYCNADGLKLQVQNAENLIFFK